MGVTLRRSIERMGLGRAARTLAAVNQPQGFDCPGCAWPEADPGARHRIEFCENGAKAVAEEATMARADRRFFAEHPIADLLTRSDHWLGESGRLVEPMIRRTGATHYEPCDWDEAYVEVAGHLASLDHPDQAVFYTSGRTSNEAAFLYQLFVRSFGTNNLPDCSNMCHEATGVALSEAIGIGKGSVRLEDFDLADVIVVVGQNPGTNHPRMLVTLEAASRRGATIVAVNPLPEAGLLRFRNPKTLSGLVAGGTPIADLHLPIALGADRSLFQLWNRWLLRDDEAGARRLDHEFIESHTSGLAEMTAHLAGLDEAAAIAHTGLDPALVEAAYRVVGNAERLIICWAMGITQHVGAVGTIREIANLALLGGHVGRPGAGLCPVRGHSNVQGDRTMGIWERPSSSFLDALSAEFGIGMPREPGVDAVDAVRAFDRGDARILVSMGGNLVRAVSDTEVAEAALGRAALTVHVSTKLNRSHLIGRGTSVILPALGRTEIDRSPLGEQFVTVEDSMGLVHASRGVIEPASEQLRSEVSIVCDLALAVLGREHAVPWRQLRDDNDAVRDRIQRVVGGFERFNERARRPGGFQLPHPPRDARRFDTPDGRAHFAATPFLFRGNGSGSTSEADDRRRDGELLLQTLRSHDQYNTTIYGFDDRYRGLSGNRRIVMVNPDDIADLGLRDGDRVDLVSVFSDRERRATDYRVVAYPTPRGCAAAYYPETNVLIPLDHQSPEAGTPASKAVPIRLEPCNTADHGDTPIAGESLPAAAAFLASTIVAR